MEFASMAQRRARWTSSRSDWRPTVPYSLIDPRSSRVPIDSRFEVVDGSAHGKATEWDEKGCDIADRNRRAALEVCFPPWPAPDRQDRHPHRAHQLLAPRAPAADPQEQHEVQLHLLPGRPE